jgi:hypothetical protein
MDSGGIAVVEVNQDNIVAMAQVASHSQDRVAE